MLISSGKSLKGLTSLKVGGTAKYLCFISSESELEEFYRFSKEEHVPMVIVGEMTNTFFGDKEIKALIAIMAMKGIRVISDFSDSSIIEIKAGENWDGVVEWSIQNGLSGIESMSGIPGSVGAAPVQNIGAYGSELSDVFVRCHVFDKNDKTFKDIGLADCKFTYRNSIFKKENNPYIIVSVTIELKKSKPELPEYKDLQEYFKHFKRRPTSKQIRNAVLEIRSKKLPDPKVVPNCGSFFTNPIIETDKAKELINQYPTIPYFQTDKGVKIPAGWLIEKSGLKGKGFGNVSISKDNALVLTTNGDATFSEIIRAREFIKKEVQKNFGILLEQEPRIIEIY